MRSLLSVHAQDTDALAVAISTKADVLIIDLTHRENVPASAFHESAQAALKAARGRLKVFVRVNATRSGMLDADLAAIMPLNPEGILLPDAVGNADIEHLATKLRVFEALQGATDGQTAIIPLINTSTAVLAVAALRPHRRLAAVAWLPFHSRPDFAASDIMSEEGDYFDVPRHVRTLTLLAASHLHVPAIDAPCPYRTDNVFYRNAMQSRRDGFCAQVTHSESQVETINGLFQR